MSHGETHFPPDYHREHIGFTEAHSVNQFIKYERDE